MQDPTPERSGSARPTERRGAAAAAGPASGGAASWLQRVFEEARGSSQLSVAPAEPPPVTVVAVQRYLAEAPPPPAAAPQYWYDVTLADGACQERCYLAPRLNGLVQRAHLRAGARLRLTRCSYLYDEKRLNYGFLCLEELERVGGAGPPAEPPRHRPLPLRGERKHYLPLWNNEDPYGDVWVVDKPQAQVDVDGKRRGGGFRGRGCRWKAAWRWPSTLGRPVLLKTSRGTRKDETTVACVARVAGPSSLIRSDPPVALGTDTDVRYASQFTGSCYFERVF